MHVPELQSAAAQAFLSARGACAAQGIEALPTAAGRRTQRLRIGGSEYILTLFAAGPAPERLEALLGILEGLGSEGLACPLALADGRGARVGRVEAASAVLYPALPGVPAAEPRPEHCQAVGETLGRLHRLGAAQPEVPRHAHGLPAWRETARRLSGQLDAAGEALLREEIRFQGLFRLTDLPTGLVHGAPLPVNVLFEQDRLSGVVGWWSAGTEVLLFDLAAAANDWCSRGDLSLDPPRVRALLDGYRAERPFSAMERGAWPVMLRGAALRFWLAGLTGEDPRIDAERYRNLLVERVGNRERLPW